MATEFKGRVIIFSIPTCRFCKRAKALLSDLAVPYHDVNVERYPERRQEAQARTGRRSVPQIFFNDKHIGGYDELKKAVSVRTEKGKTVLVCVCASVRARAHGVFDQLDLSGRIRPCRVSLATRTTQTCLSVLLILYPLVHVSHTHQL